MSDTSLAADEGVGPRRVDEAYARADFASSFHDHHERLLRIAFLLSGDHDLAEDVVADAFVKAYPHLVRGGVDDPGAYLRRAVVNGFKRQIGRRVLERRERSRNLRVVGPGSFEDQAVEHDRLLTALGELPLRQRAVVVLRFYDDRSETETADLLGISAGSVKTHSHRGLTRLRTILTEEQR